MRIQVKELKLIDTNEVIVLDITDKNIMLETEDGFVGVSYDSHGSRRHELMPSTSINRIIFYQ